MENDSIYYFKYEANKIAKINLLSSKVDSLILPKEIITGSIHSINILNKDSIILVQDNPQSLILIKEGEASEISILPKISFTCKNDMFNRYSNTLANDEGNYILDYTHTYYDEVNQSIHIGIKPFMACDNKGFEKTERMGIFSMKSKKWEHIYAPPKGMLRYKGDKTFTYYLSQKRTFAKKDTLFISYFNDHYIYYYKNGIYLGKFPHSSQHAKKMFLPVNSSYTDDEENRKKYTYAAPKYGNFYYHKKVKLYSRLYFDQQEPLDSKGKYKHPELLRDIYVVFLDEQFRHVGEYKFPKGSITFNSCKPTSDGFLLFDMNYTANSKKEFGLKYKYKIVPVAE